MNVISTITSNARFVDTAGGRVRSFEAGAEEAPLVLCIHGLANSIEYWHRLVPELAQHARVVAYDIPGFGQSATPTSGVTIPAAVGAATKILAGRLPAAIVGHSMGAVVALAMAQQNPDRVGSLVLANAAVDRATRALHPFSFGWLSQPGATLLAQAAIGLSSLPAGLARTALGNRAMRSLFLHPFVADPGSFDPDEAAALASLKRSPSAVVQALAIARRSSLAEMLNRCTTRTVLVTGADDHLSPPAAQADLADGPAVAASFVIERCGHWTQLEKPAELAEIILAEIG